MQLPKGPAILEWIIKWNHIVEPHVFTFAQPEMYSQLCSSCPEEWISFIDHQSEINADILQEKLLKLIKFSDPSIHLATMPDEEYWPKSLIGFLKEAKSVSISRAFSGTYNYSNETLRMSKMGRKKYHEVQLLSQLILDYARRLNVRGIVDIGSGSGYLTVELSKKYPILAIDSDESQICHSKKRNEEFPQFQKVIHLTQKLDSSSLFSILSEYDLVQRDTDRFEFQKSCGKTKQKILITCLHACGDLSSEVLLNSFVQCSWISCVISIGCCYQMLSPKGFPLSKFVKDQTKTCKDKYPFMAQEHDNLLLPTYRSLNSACQTMVGFSDKRITDVWKAFTFRSLLESFLRTQNKDFDLSQPQLSIGTLKKDAFKHGFSHYAISAKPELILLKEELEYFQKSMSYPILYGRISFMSTLRRFFGSVMESLLLYDRYSYLSEDHDFHADLMNVFKHDISPRNIAVVAIRK